MPSKNKSNELTLSRVYDAPVAAVWDAWTDPEQAAKWWGPRGFTITTHGKELKPGGFWRYTMHGPDGVDYPNKTIYHEVEKHKRLVYDHGGSDDRPPMFRVTVTFEEIGEQTRMEMTMAFPSPEEAIQAKKFIKTAGGHSTWDRLAEYLTKEKNEREIFVINRSFKASIDTMFEMWSNPRHVSRWMAPEGLRMEYIQADIAEGKTSFFKMTSDDNTLVMHGKIHYLKIKRPDYLEYSQSFSDEKGNLSKHPRVPTWPDHMLTKVLLTKEGDDQTRVTLTWEPQGKVSAAELKAFVEMRGSMTQGWTGSFDKLEALLGTEI
ncbi:MAG: SRPBCC domain-containing protein [Bdellovibrionaceae bacterium]|nr:SRPBCC domain-containing protein [Pseudobdellovibrionaceae bacterium]